MAFVSMMDSLRACVGDDEANVIVDGIRSRIEPEALRQFAADMGITLTCDECSTLITEHGSASDAIGFLLQSRSK